MGRVAYGIPRRVDRLRCLGNAIVPQVAEVVARMTKDILDGE
jgi:DNA (cytosine-5)-methyltransferase 1